MRYYCTKWSNETLRGVYPEQDQTLRAAQGDKDEGFRINITITLPVFSKKKKKNEIEEN